MPCIFGFNIAPVVAGALIAGGSQLLGGLLGGIGAEKQAKADAEAKRRELAENRRQFGLTLKQRQDEFKRTAGQSGLDFLASQRAGFDNMGRQRTFTNDLISVARGL